MKVEQGHQYTLFQSETHIVFLIVCNGYDTISNKDIIHFNGTFTYTVDSLFKTKSTIK